MKTRKQIFRNFQYLECDAFAEYLEGIAAKAYLGQRKDTG